MKVHLFVSSRRVKPNGYQGSYDSVEAAERALPIVNPSIDRMDGLLYEVQPDGSLKTIRGYLHFKGHDWRAVRLDEDGAGRHYRIDSRGQREPVGD